MSRQSRIVLIGIILMAVALRLNGLFENTFHADEALYASWAKQIAVWRDPLLKGELVDKPPLLFYLQALFYPAAGPQMWAARLPNLIASLLMLPLTALLAWRLYRNEATTLLISSFMAFSPMAIQYSSSAFIDPLMTCLIVASLASLSGWQPTRAAIHGNARKREVGWLPALSGALFGLAIISKYQAWLFAPLLVSLAMFFCWRRTEWSRWLLGFVPVLSLQFFWEVARRSQVSVLESQWHSFGGVRLAWSWELWPRLEAWANQMKYVLGSPILGILLLSALSLLVTSRTDEDARATALDRILALFIAAYLLLLWLVAVPTWDRYLISIVPFICLLLARAIWRVLNYTWTAFLPPDRRPSWVGRILILIPVVLLLFQGPAIVDAYHARFPVGATPNADHGATAIGQALAEAPYGTVLYDHWFSWQWRYHMFDRKVYINWFPDPDVLIEDLRTFGNESNCRYIALPDSESSRPVSRALSDSGYTLEKVISAGGSNEGPSIILYLIKPTC